MVVLEWQRLGLLDGGQHLAFGSRKRVPSIIRTTACPIVTSDAEMRPNYCNVSLYAFVWQLTHCCANLWALLWARLKDPCPLDGAEVMAYLRDVVRQSDESDRSKVQQHEPSGKKDS